MADMTTTRDDRPTAIDPPGCGCTECITGMYVPLVEILRIINDDGGDES